jgi:cytoskeletal protein CcmA (bactofilin family)
MTQLSTIGRGTTVRGNVQADGDLDIQGRVEGNVTVRGELIIGDGALIRSDVTGRRVIVRGAVAGNISGEEAVVLEEGARVVGNLVAPRVGIRPGALLRGSVSTEGPLPAPVVAPASQARAPASVSSRSAPRPAAVMSAPPVEPAIVSRPAPRVAAPTARLPAVRAPAIQEARAPQPEKVIPKPTMPIAPTIIPGSGPPPPVVPSLPKGAKGSLRRKGAR